jgi:hypothetical protein
MRILYLSILLLAFCLPSHASMTFETLSPLLDTLCRGDYVAANNMVAQIESNSPGSAIAMLARACARGFRAVDITGGSVNVNVLDLLDSCADAASEMKDDPSQDQAEVSLIRGAALFARGLILCRQGKVLTGVPAVIRARSEFGNAIELNPQLYDAYLGRGAFRYIKVIFLGSIDPFHVMSSEQDARTDLMLAATNGKAGRWLAMDALAWLAPRQHQLDLADSLCTVGLARFPHTRTFLWPLLFLQEARGQWADLEKTALEMLEQYKQIPDDHGFEQIHLYGYLMTAADNLNRPQDAVAYAQAGLDVTRTPWVEKQWKDNLKKFRNRVNQK